MEEGKRPGGLTALAVFNLIFAGQGLLGFLGFAGLVVIATTTDVLGDIPAEMRKALDASGLGVEALIVLMVGELINALLLLAAGIGYLQQKKRLGRGVGNLYVLTGIAHTFAVMVVLPKEVGGAFHLGVMIGLIYPLLTAFFVNVTFREDFVR